MYQIPCWAYAKTAGLIALGFLAAFDFLPKLDDHVPPPLVSLLFLAAVDGLIALTFAAIIGLDSIPFQGGFWGLLALVTGVRAVTVLMSSDLGVPQGPAALCLSAAAPLLLVGAVALLHLVAEHTTDLAGPGERDVNQNRPLAR
ncbi:hypothetical protein [Streptomyces luteolus]|uniref:Integral membrane protein n=1 Tax=Streptomyces luteolus TaxID=3043615 RepID=A0ABT6STD2_9ACTN|nr:hypothetical protein [Streptomyces sp. B-S-A12]MDI3418606.1 hypothetical protein [Streptomyces sp. B-S-A12]